MKPKISILVFSLYALATFSAQTDAYGRGRWHRPSPGVDSCSGKYSGQMSTGRPSEITLTRSGYGDQISWSNTYEGQTYQGNGICSMNYDGSASLRVDVNNGSIVTFEGTITPSGALTGSFVGEGVTFNGTRRGGVVNPGPVYPGPGYPGPGYPGPGYPGPGYPPQPSVDPCNSSYSGNMSTGKPSTITLTRVGAKQVVWSNTYERKTYTGRGTCDARGDGSAYISVEVNNGQIVTFQGSISAHGQLSGAFVNEGVSFTGSRAR